MYFVQRLFQPDDQLAPLRRVHCRNRGVGHSQHSHRRCLPICAVAFAVTEGGYRWPPPLSPLLELAPLLELSLPLAGALPPEVSLPADRAPPLGGSLPADGAPPLGVSRPADGVPPLTGPPCSRGAPAAGVSPPPTGPPWSGGAPAPGGVPPLRRPSAGSPVARTRAVDRPAVPAGIWATALAPGEVHGAAVNAAGGRESAVARQAAAGLGPPVGGANEPAAREPAQPGGSPPEPAPPARRKPAARERALPEAGLPVLELPREPVQREGEPRAAAQPRVGSTAWVPPPLWPPRVQLPVRAPAGLGR